MYSIYNIRDGVFDIIYIIRDDDVFEIIYYRDDAYIMYYMIQFLLIDGINAL